MLQKRELVPAVPYWLRSLVRLIWSGISHLVLSGSRRKKLKQINWPNLRDNGGNLQHYLQYQSTLSWLTEMAWGKRLLLPLLKFKDSRLKGVWVGCRASGSLTQHWEGCDDYFLGWRRLGKVRGLFRQHPATAPGDVRADGGADPAPACYQPVTEGRLFPQRTLFEVRCISTSVMRGKCPSR